MQNINSIMITFENCESINVDGKYIGNFYITNITRNIYKAGSIFMNQRKCETFFIELLPEVDKLKDDGLFEEYTSVFNRIQRHDIVDITLCYTDGTNEQFYVDWNENDDYINSYQSDYISRNNCMYIAVNKDNTVFDYVDIAVIDDEAFKIIIDMQKNN